MRISDEDINAIRNRASITDIIGRYIPLVKKGRSMSAVCPFHDDHDPSLSISEEKQVYKCFACGNGGNVYTFVQNYEKCSFIEAVCKVAELIDYPLEIQKSSFETKKDPRKEALYKCMNEAIHFMHFQLNTLEGKPALEYLIKRGLDKTILDRFEIGFNGGNDQVVHFLQAKGYPESDMLACNLARMNEQGIKDVFFNRITFPIHDSLGNPIAFTARSMNPENSSKYINSNETELYIKSNVVYNYHRAKDACRKEARVIVTEGVMDVIAFARAGIDHVVATLGTACTKEQIRLIKQCSNHVVFCYDGDRAGRKATLKAAKLAQEAGLEVSIIQNKTGLDPDEIITKYGLDELKAMSKNEIVWMEFIFDEYQNQFNLDNYSERKQFALVIKNEIDALKDDFDRQSFYHRLSTLTGFTMAQLGETVQFPIKKEIHTTKIRLNPLENGKTNAEKFILSQMLTSRQASEIFKNELGFLSNENCQHCAMLILDHYRKEEKMNLAELLDHCSNDLQKQLLLDLDSNEVYLKQFDEELLRGSIKRFKRAMLEDRIAEIKGQIQKILDPESKMILITEKTQLQRELGDLKNED